MLPGQADQKECEKEEKPTPSSQEGSQEIVEIVEIMDYLIEEVLAFAELSEKFMPVSSPQMSDMRSDDPSGYEGRGYWVRQCHQAQNFAEVSEKRK